MVPVEPVVPGRVLGAIWLEAPVPPSAIEDTAWTISALTVVADVEVVRLTIAVSAIALSAILVEDIVREVTGARFADPWFTIVA